MEKLGERCLYTDTDSLIYRVAPGEEDLPLGNFLGDLTCEITGKYGPGSFISTYVSGGPKNYSYKVYSPRDGTYHSEIKVKGLNLNYRTKKIVNFDSLVDIITGDPDKELIVNNPNTIRRNVKDCTIFNRDESKRYRCVYTKRAFDPNNRYSTLPYGY